jgi:hypothetical protein
VDDLISDIKKYKKGWHSGLPETPCGSGSRLSKTQAQRKWIPEIIRQYGIKTVADIGAGDLNWIEHTDLSGVEYTPYDLVPRRRDVIAFDLVHEIPPTVDMIMCLWVLNHFPYDPCKKAIENLKASGSQYLLMTDRPKWRENQPPEIKMAHIEELELNYKGDRMLLIELC